MNLGREESTYMTQVIVTVDAQHRESIDEVVRRLRGAGMTVHRVLPRSGIVTGDIAEPAAKRLSGLDGVLAVEEAGVQHTL
jgi:hypothetical protein